MEEGGGTVVASYLACSIVEGFVGNAKWHYTGRFYSFSGRRVYSKRNKAYLAKQSPYYH
jgi:hypothetical protein